MGLSETIEYLETIRQQRRAAQMRAYVAQTTRARTSSSSQLNRVIALAKDVATNGRYNADRPPPPAPMRRMTREEYFRYVAGKTR